MEDVKELPPAVIERCEDCAWCGRGLNRRRCEHGSAPVDSSEDARAAGRPGPTGTYKTVLEWQAPPSWCPLRRKA